MLRHTPNSELLFLLIEKGSEDKNWAQYLPRGFIATPQASLRANQKRDGQSTRGRGSHTMWLPRGKETGMQAFPTQGAKDRDGNRPGRDQEKAHFSKVLLFILLPICHYVLFRPSVDLLAHNKRSKTILIAPVMKNSTNGRW